MSETTNEDRAEWARQGLLAFGRACGLDRSGDIEDIQLVMGDFLTNLLHLCDLEKIELEDVLDGSYETYLEEWQEEHEDQKELESLEDPQADASE